MTLFTIDENRCRQDGICADICPVKIIRFTEKKHPSPVKNAEKMCIRCGHCVHACPMKLLPTTIEKYVMVENIERAIELGLNDCIECGSCAYVCPSHRRLVHQFKFGKYLAWERKKKADSAREEKGD